jgi:hypothetical protein
MRLNQRLGNLYGRASRSGVARKKIINRRRVVEWRLTAQLDEASMGSA